MERVQLFTRYKEKNMELHPDVIAWEKWLDSREGMIASKPYEGTLERQYLENRLQEAFYAGRRSIPQ